MRGYAAIGLDNAKNHYNVGGVMRAASVYDAAMVAVSGGRFKPASTDPLKSHKHMPVLRTDDLFNVAPYGAVPVAVELCDYATPIQEYTHPEAAFYIFGAEDQTLGSRVLSRCRDVVYVPTRRCMNLAVTVNVVLFHRALTRDEWPVEEPLPMKGAA